MRVLLRPVLARTRHACAAVSSLALAQGTGRAAADGAAAAAPEGGSAAADAERDCIVFERQVAGAPLAHVSVAAMLADLAHPDRRLVLVGETHDDGLAHVLERQIFARLSRADAPSSAAGAAKARGRARYRSK